MQRNFSEPRQHTFQTFLYFLSKDQAAESPVITSYCNHPTYSEVVQALMKRKKRLLQFIQRLLSGTHFASSKDIWKVPKPRREMVITLCQTDWNLSRNAMQYFHIELSFKPCYK